MLEKRVIVVGDTTTHGGTVLTGSEILEVRTKPVAAVGDKVNCPQHGETVITQGFDKVVLESGATLAYEGCLTSCGATLISTQQDIFYIELPPPSPILDAVLSSNAKTEKEFHLFVATIYGEGANQSVAAWQAIGSVIMNRVGNPIWRKANQSVTSVILKTGFDAAKKEKNDAFIRASQYLDGNQAALNAYEKKVIERMIVLVNSIYYEGKVTTKANYYYSPKLQKITHDDEVRIDPKHVKHKLPPDWIKQYELVHVSGLKSSDDLQFYYQK